MALVVSQWEAEVLPGTSPHIEEISQAIAGLRSRMVAALKLKGGPGLQDVSATGDGDLCQKLTTIRFSLLEAHRRKRHNGEDVPEQSGWAERLEAAEARWQEEKMRADSVEKQLARLQQEVASMRSQALPSPVTPDRAVQGFAAKPEEHLQQISEEQTQQIAQLQGLALELQDVTTKQQQDIAAFEQRVVEYEARERDYQVQVEQLYVELRAASAASQAAPTSPSGGEALRAQLAEMQARERDYQAQVEQLYVELRAASAAPQAVPTSPSGGEALHTQLAETQAVVDQLQARERDYQAQVEQLYLELRAGETFQAQLTDAETVVVAERQRADQLQERSAGDQQRIAELVSAVGPAMQRVEELESALGPAQLRIEELESALGPAQLRIEEVESALRAAQDLAAQNQQTQLAVDARIGQMADGGAVANQIAAAEQAAAAYRQRAEELEVAIAGMRLQASQEATAARQEAEDERHRSADLEKMLAELRDAERDYLAQIATLQIAAKADAAGGLAEKQRAAQLELRCGRLEARLAEEQQAAKASATRVVQLEESEAAQAQQGSALQDQLRQAEALVQDSKARLFELQAVAEAAQQQADAGEKIRADMEVELTELRMVKQEFESKLQESIEVINGQEAVISSQEIKIRELEAVPSAGQMNESVPISPPRIAAPSEPVSVAARQAAVVQGRPSAAQTVVPSINVVSPADSLFNMMDRNHDGRITRAEWDQAMQGATATQPATVLTVPSASYVAAGGSYTAAAPATVMTRKPISPITTTLPSVTLAPPVSPYGAAPISPTAVVSPGLPVSPGIPVSPTAVVGGPAISTMSAAAVTMAGTLQTVSPPTSVVTQPGVGIPKLVQRPGPQARGGSVAISNAPSMSVMSVETLRMASVPGGALAAPVAATTPALTTAAPLAAAPLAPNLRPGM